MNRRLVLKALGLSAALAAAGNPLEIGSLAQTAEAQTAAKSGEPFALPPLPYAYDALEPYIDATTMHLHHDKHHQGYVNNLNATVAAHPELAGKTLEQLMTNLNGLPDAARTAVRNNGGGHFNHSFWWPTLGKGGSAPAGELAKAIDTGFGSLSAMQKKLTSAAMSVFGSGWAWLVKLPDGALSIETTPNQDCPLTGGHTPVLGVDVWEHVFPHPLQHDLGCSVLKVLPAELLVLKPACILSCGEDVPGDGLASQRGFFLFDGLKLIQALEEEQVGYLLDDFIGVGNATRPERIPDAVNLIANFTCHVCLLYSPRHVTASSPKN